MPQTFPVFKKFQDIPCPYTAKACPCISTAAGFVFSPKTARPVFVTEIIEPIATNDSDVNLRKEHPSGRPTGRLADKAAAVISVIAGVLAIIGSVIFFAGFAANDSHLAALTSAFTFTALLGAFAIAPPLLIARLAWRAYKQGGTRKSAAFGLLLSGPWVILSGLLISHTPLPLWVSWPAFIIALLLAIWSIAGLFLEK